MAYDVFYYFGDKIKGNFHYGVLIISEAKVYLKKDDKSIFSLDKITDGYIITDDFKYHYVKLYSNNYILNLVALNSVFIFGKYPCNALTEKLYKNLVKKFKIGVYRK